MTDAIIIGLVAVGAFHTLKWALAQYVRFRNWMRIKLFGWLVGM